MRSFSENLVLGTLYKSISGKVESCDSTKPGFAPTYTLSPVKMKNEGLSVEVDCVGNELSRVHVGTPIVAYTSAYYACGIIGLVTATTGTSFTISYLSNQIMSGKNYYLFIWRPTMHP